MIFFTALATFCLACLSLECAQNLAKIDDTIKNHVSRELKSDCNPEHLVILEAFNELEKTLVTYATRAERIGKVLFTSLGLGFTSMLIVIIRKKADYLSGVLAITASTLWCGVPAASILFYFIVSKIRDNMILKQLKTINKLLIKEGDAVYYLPFELEHKITKILKKFRTSKENTQIIEQMEILCRFLNQYFISDKIWFIQETIL